MICFLNTSHFQLTRWQPSDSKNDRIWFLVRVVTSSTSLEVDRCLTRSSVSTARSGLAAMDDVPSDALVFAHASTMPPIPPEVIKLFPKSAFVTRILIKGFGVVGAGTKAFSSSRMRFAPMLPPTPPTQGLGVAADAIFSILSNPRVPARPPLQLSLSRPVVEARARFDFSRTPGRRRVPCAN